MNCRLFAIFTQSEDFSKNSRIEDETENVYSQNDFEWVFILVLINRVPAIVKIWEKDGIFTVLGSAIIYSE